MLSFRHGADLYEYCSRCIHIATTPITGLIGCTIGDQSDVRVYSNDIESGKVDENVEKCPGFESETSEPGFAAPREAGSAQAGMVKEIPMEMLSTIRNTPDDFKDSLDDALAGLDDEPRATILSLVNELLEDSRVSQTPEYLEPEYDQANLRPPAVRRSARKTASNVVESPGGNVAEVSDPMETQELFEMLKNDYDLSPQDNPEMAREKLLQAMLSWQGGLLALHTDLDTLEAVRQSFNDWYRE